MRQYILTIPEHLALSRLLWEFLLSELLFLCFWFRFIFSVVVVFFLYPSRSFTRMSIHSDLSVLRLSNVNFYVKSERNTKRIHYYITFPQCRTSCDLFEFSILIYSVFVFVFLLIKYWHSASCQLIQLSLL